MKMAATGPRSIPGQGPSAVIGGGTAVDAPASREDLVRDHASRVYRLAYGLTRNPHDAEDLTQNVFDRVFRNLASYKPGNFDGWLYRITVNLFRDQLRRSRRLRLEPLREDAVNLYPARQPSPEQAASEPVFDDDVREALAALHPDVRNTVLLFDVDGLTYDEIAAALGVPRGTVGSRIHRGRAQLRTALAHRSPRTRQAAAATAVRAAA
jgi:RNA polymerase sigma-70 factor (ECF subfamily)